MTTFSVKNYEQFQHYRDRTPPWIKLYNSILEDYAFGALPDETKAHLIQIWLLASRMNNKIPYDQAWVSQKINATKKVDLELLFSMNFIIKNNDASTMLAICYQDASAEREREADTEGEVEKEKNILKDIPKERELLALPDWLDREIWQAYLQTRKTKKAASTDRALSAVLRKAESFGRSPTERNKVLEQSIISGWTDVYPLKDQPIQQKGKREVL